MTLAEPKTRRWTREEYYRLAEQGYFSGQRVQLLEGEILHMAPQGYPHAEAYLSTVKILTAIFGPDSIRPQLPLNVPGESDPEPDVAVTKIPRGRFKDHPTTAAVVVEIADSSIYLDRRKAGLYAAAEVPEYWIVNLNTGRLEVFRTPVADQTVEFGHRYAENFELSENDLVSQLNKPDTKIRVKELFE
jgi:Uma2 family endonuclease